MRSNLSHPLRPVAGPPAVRTAAPEPLTTTKRFDSFRTLLGTLLFLVLSVFLSSASLVEIAERMEFGPERDRWLNAATIVHEASGNLYLDRPGDWIREVVDYQRGPGVEGPNDGVVIGDLAAGDQLISTSDAETAEADTPAETEAPDSDPVAFDDTDDPAVEPSVDATGEDAGDDVPEASAEPAPAPPQLREITEEQPLRMWLGGDSLGQFMAAHIAYRIAPPERSDIAIDYHISTGLARPDYFDWPAHLTSVISEEDRPEALVFMVGGNDDQAMRLQATRLEPMTPEWLEEYSRRVGLLMDVTAYSDTRLFWVLLPPMDEDRREIISNQINDIVKLEAGSRPWVTLVEIDDLFVDSNGNFSRFIDDADGVQQLARQQDGVHITEVSSRWVADRVWAEVTALWPTADPNLDSIEPAAEPEVSPDE